MIVTVWITPPRSPHADPNDPHLGIRREIFNEPFHNPTTFMNDIRDRIVAKDPSHVVEFGPVSTTGFGR